MPATISLIQQGLLITTYHPLNILPNSAIMDYDKMVSDVDREFVAPFTNKFHSDNTN